MKSILKRKLANIDLLIIGLSSGNLSIPKELEQFETAFSISTKSKQFDGKVGSEVLLHGNDSIKHLLILGLGDKKEIELEHYRKMGGLAGKYAKKLHCTEPVVFLTELAKDISEEDATQAVTEAMIMGSYEFNELK